MRWQLTLLVGCFVVGTRPQTTCVMASVSDVGGCANDTGVMANASPTRATLSHYDARVQLATAYRALAAQSLNCGSGLGSHLTMSVGDNFSNFLVIRYGLHWFEAAPENLQLVDPDGNILEGEGPVQAAAVALHGPVHIAKGAAARVIFHTHQPWFTALACIKFGGLRMFHPDASIYEDRVGFDPVYTGNWPKGSAQGALKEGERLLANPHLQGKEIIFLGNHGSFLVASSVEQALFDCFNLERLAQQQVSAMMFATPFRELAPSKLLALKEQYKATRNQMATNHYDYVTQIAAPLPTAWDGIGRIPLSSSLRLPRQSFAAYTMDEAEWRLRLNMAAACRMIARLNGIPTFEGSFAHFSIAIDNNTFLLVPPTVPFAAVRASMLLVVDAKGEVIRGVPSAGYQPGQFEEINRARYEGSNREGKAYPALLFTHTVFTDRLAHAGKRLRFMHQSAFNFADDHFGYFEAWSTSGFSEDLLSYIKESNKVMVMLSHGGCIVRGVDAAHVFALVHGFDAAAQIQVYAEMTGMPLLDLPEEQVRTFPKHGYGDMTIKSKRMELYFAANMRLLLSNWNQGTRDTGDSSFAL